MAGGVIAAIVLMLSGATPTAGTGAPVSPPSRPISYFSPHMITYDLSTAQGTSPLVPEELPADAHQNMRLAREGVDDDSSVPFTVSGASPIDTRLVLSYAPGGGDDAAHVSVDGGIAGAIWSARNR